jgi:hypothetical protein
MVILQPYTAGSPMNEGIRWTNLSWTRISELLKGKGLDVGRYVVKKLMKQLGYVRRKMVKCKTMAQVAFRNEQFEYIQKITREFIFNGLPVLSLDTKKKELLGSFYRDGYLLTHEQINVFDHDFKSFSDGTVVPHGIYDLYQNICYLTLGHSSDTAEFMCDNLRYHWKNHIRYHYPFAGKILLLCDGGGSNSCRSHIVKEALHDLAKELDIEIVVAHYPAYCSKWNPIEHKAFCHITRAWQGVVFDSMQTVELKAKRAITKTGFSVKVWQNLKEYKTGKTATDEFLIKYPVKFNTFLPKWNYSLKTS